MGCLGLFGNIFSIVMFSRKKFQKNFHQLMSCLAVYDLFYILQALVLFTAPQLVLIHISMSYLSYTVLSFHASVDMSPKIDS